MSTLATASKTIVATKRNTSRERRCSCVGVTARATMTTSRPRARRGWDTDASIPDRAVDDSVILLSRRGGSRQPCRRRGGHRIDAGSVCATAELEQSDLGGRHEAHRQPAGADAARYEQQAVALFEDAAGVARPEPRWGDSLAHER